MITNVILSEDDKNDNSKRHSSKKRRCDYLEKRRCFESEMNIDSISIDFINDYNLDAYEFEQLVMADVNGVKNTLKNLRKSLNISTTELELIANIPHQTLLNIESTDMSGTRFSSIVRYKYLLELMADQKELSMRASICAELLNTLDRPARDELFRHYGYVPKTQNIK